MNETDYIASIQTAVDYIEDHLDDDVNTAAVAAHIGFSEFHFHRVFMNVVGETITAYQRRRRLSGAARRLKESQTSILEIALDAKFGSQEAFTRAFKALFGCTPGEYRKRDSVWCAIEKVKLTPEMVKHLRGGLTMEPKFVDFPGQHVIGMAKGFPLDASPAIAELWGQFVKQSQTAGLCGEDNRAFGVCMGQHPQVEKKEGETFVYMAAFPTDAAQEAPEGMLSYDIAPGRYAVFTHKGNISTFPHTVKYVWGTWVPEHRDLFREDADFELYDERFNPETGEGEVDIFIPVRVK